MMAFGFLEKTFIHIGDRTGDPSSSISSSKGLLTEEQRSDGEVSAQLYTGVGMSKFLDYPER